MKMTRALFIAVVIAALLPGLCQAEFYRYKDAGGTWRYTDDISEVPEDQRPEEYKGVDDGLSEEEKTAKRLDQASKAEVRRQKYGTRSGSLSKNPDRAFASLKAEEKDLEKLGKKLRAEQDALIKARESNPSGADMAVINKKVLALNKRVEAYEKKRTALLKKIDAYNRMIQSQD